jgi:hypothetical protein
MNARGGVCTLAGYRLSHPHAIVALLFFDRKETGGGLALGCCLLLARVALAAAAPARAAATARATRPFTAQCKKQAVVQRARPSPRRGGTCPGQKWMALVPQGPQASGGGRLQSRVHVGSCTAARFSPSRWLALLVSARSTMALTIKQGKQLSKPAVITTNTREGTFVRALDRLYKRHQREHSDASMARSLHLKLILKPCVIRNPL